MMKKQITKIIGLAALVVVGLVAVGQWSNRAREMHSATQDNTFLYEAAAMFNNQNYVRW
jgi:hypothetical protein